MQMRSDNYSDGNISKASVADASEPNATNMGAGKASINAANTSAAFVLPPMPKHIPFPEYFNTSEIINELIMSLFTTGVAILQFINIYRTNWWLPESSVKNVVNLNLIEPHMRDLLLLFTTRRFHFALIIYCIKRYKHKVEEHRMLCNIFKYWFGGTQLAIMGYCIWQIVQPHSYVLLFFLIYPGIVYLLTFGFQMESFVRTTIEGTYFNGMPLHCCTSNAGHIREEVETLRNDFNKRFKQVMFTSFSFAYYTGLVPCMLAHNIQYNLLRAAQHIVMVWLCTFSLSTVFLFPAKYSDILHRASLHLGSWRRLEVHNTDSTSTPVAIADAATWCKSTVYAHGSIIKYNGVLYQSYGLATVAMPENASQARFYKLFHNPTIIYSTLSALQATVIIVEIISLRKSLEWHFLLSISFIAFTNQFPFFKFVRDYLITKRLYLAECVISSDRQHYN